MIDVEVVDAQLEYIIFLSRSYMYTIKEVSSRIFCTMIFPFKGKDVTLDHLIYYKPLHFLKQTSII